MNTPVELIRYNLRHLKVAWEIEPELQKLDTILTEAVKTSYDYDIFTDAKNPAVYGMVLKLKFETFAGGKPNGYDIEIDIAGVFDIQEKDLPKSKVQMLFRLNAVAALYGVARGIISTVSSTFAQGPFFAPSVMPQDIVEKTETAKAARMSKEEAEKQPSAPDNAEPVKV